MDNRAANPRDVLSASELSAFCAQIAMILKSGIPVSEGVGIMADDAKHTQGKEILQAIHSRVEWVALCMPPLLESGKFPGYVVNMVEIGETTGKLEQVMDSLCGYYEREESVARSVKNAVTYPLIMIAMMVLVIAVLVVKVLPIFNQVFVGLGSEMTGFSLAVLRMGQAIGSYAFVILGVIAAIALILVLLNVTSGGKRALERFKASFFATRSLYAKIASGRFASAMALMLASGLDTDQSLEMVHKLIDNPTIRAKIERCQQLLREDVTFSDALVRAGIFSGIHARMVTVAFKPESLDGVMQKLAGRYEEETDNQISAIISVLEPTLVAVLSIIVGMILLSVMLPLMGIMSSIG